MRAPDWLADIATSYDTVAESYADLLRGALGEASYERMLLALFAKLVRSGGGGPVVDVGCGPGRLTGHLHTLGLDVSGIDLSPGMIEVARRDHPGLRFAVGSMTELDLPDSSVGGLLAWFSLIHLPDDVVGDVLARFHRALRPEGVLLLAFHNGDEVRLKTEGYGGHPMRVHVHYRRPEQVADWLRDGGFTVEADLRHYPKPGVQGAFLVARRPT